MGYIDLHVHSTYSDGTYTPEELILLAKKANLVAISLTDHDTISGIESAILAGEKYQIQVIPGIELSAKYKDKDIHILGYQIDYKSSSLHKKLMEYEAVRERRNEKIIDCLNKIGFSITVEDIRKRFPIGTITRLHIAKYLVECGYVKSLQEVFQKYLGERYKHAVYLKNVSAQEDTLIIKYKQDIRRGCLLWRFIYSGTFYLKWNEKLQNFDVKHEEGPTQILKPKRR